jgi:hypothetical protein
MKLTKTQWTLLGGDTIVLLLVTLYGLASHDMMNQAAADVWRTFLPWLVAWLLIGWPVGVFDPGKANQAKQLWRPFWGMILASPLGGFLRSAALGSDVIVLFVVVFGGISAIAITFWRAVYWFFTTRR